LTGRPVGVIAVGVIAVHVDGNDTRIDWVDAVRVHMDGNDGTPASSGVPGV
jgi:hypothetical protein